LQQREQADLHLCHDRLERTHQKDKGSCSTSADGMQCCYCVVTVFSAPVRFQKPWLSDSMTCCMPCAMRTLATSYASICIDSNQQRLKASFLGCCGNRVLHLQKAWAEYAAS
jgi:hypothetical protein